MSIVSCFPRKSDLAKLTGSQGQFVGFTADNVVGAVDAPAGLPSGGTTGQMLYQGESGAEWGNKPVMYVKINKIDGIYSVNRTFAEILEAYQNGYAVLIGDPSGFYQGGVITNVSNNSINIYDPTTINGGRRITINNDDTITTEEVPILPSATDGNQVLISKKPLGDNPPMGYNIYRYEWDDLSAISSVVYVHLEGVGAVQSDMTPNEILDAVRDGKLVVCLRTYMGAVANAPILSYDLSESSNSSAVFVGLDGEMNMHKATVSSDKSVTTIVVGKYLERSGGTMTGPLVLNGDPVIGNHAANKAYVDSKAPKYRTVTLTASGWSSNAQTVTVQGVLADESAQLIQPMPAVASQNAYISAGVICSGQAANQLSFTCSTTPTEDISLYVVLTEVQS